MTVVALAPAADVFWVGATGLPPGDGTTFDSSLNWSPMAVPTSTDRAIFDAVGGTIFFPGVAISNERLLIAGPAPDVTFDLNAGVYLLLDPGTSGSSRGLIVGLEAGDDGTLTLANGTIVAESAAVAVEASSIGELTLESNSIFSLSDSLAVGEAGQATVTVLGSLICGPVTMAEAITASCVATIDGGAGLWLALGPVVLAEGGMADVSVINGGKFIATQGVITAAQPGSSATLLVRDPGTIAVIEGGLVVGGDSLGPGGSTLVAIDNDGLLRATPFLIVRVDATLDIVGSRVETAEMTIDGGDAIVNVAGTLVVSDTGSTTARGVYVGIENGTGTLTVRQGGTLLSSEGVVAADENSAGTLVLVDGGTSASFSQSVTVGSEPEPLERDGAPGVLSLREGATMDVSNALVVGQRGSLELFGGSTTVGTALLRDEGLLRVDMPQSGTGIESTFSAEAGGGLVVRLPGKPPLVGSTYDVLRAPFIDGGIAVVGSPKLAADRYITLTKVPVTGGEALRLGVAILPLQFTFAAPGSTDLEQPPADVVVAAFDEKDELPQAGISVPAPDAEDPGTVQVLANVAPPGQQPMFDVVASVPVGEDPGNLVQGSLFNSRGTRGPKPDMAVSNRGGNSVTLIRNETPSAQQAGPPFVPDVELDVGGVPAGLAIADIDGDGTPEDPDNDLAVAVAAPKGAAAAQPGYVAIFYNEGGSFGPLYQPVYAGIDPKTSCPIDLTGDKLLDLIVANLGGEKPAKPIEGPCVTVHFNLGNGSFCDPPKVYEVGKGPIESAEVDLNGDGYIDVITANSIDGTISVLVGQEIRFAPSCTQYEPFLAAVDLDAGGLPVAMAAAAFDLLEGEEAADEDIDIAVIVEDPDTGVQTLNVFRNDSANGQVVLTLLPDVQGVPGIPNALAGADTDGDGTPDLVSVGENTGGGVAGPTNGFISVYLSVPTCPGDLAGDGVVDGADLGEILAAWGTVGANVPQDINGDGIVDSADLGLLLQNWGVCDGE